jgi:hypothetical protein
VRFVPVEQGLLIGEGAAVEEVAELVLPGLGVESNGRDHGV